MHSFLMFIEYVCFCVRVHASVENELAVKKKEKKRKKKKPIVELKKGKKGEEMKERERGKREVGIP